MDWTAFGVSLRYQAMHDSGDSKMLETQDSSTSGRPIPLNGTSGAVGKGQTTVTTLCFSMVFSFFGTRYTCSNIHCARYGIDCIPYQVQTAAPARIRVQILMKFHSSPKTRSQRQSLFQDYDAVYARHQQLTQAMLAVDD